MKRYDEYKNSGILWIGEIPNHWEVVRLKNVVSCNDETLSEKIDANEIIEYVEIGDVEESKGITNTTHYLFKNAPSRARRITRKDDVIVSTVRTYLKAIARINRDGLIVSTGFAVLRPKSIDPLYIAYFSKCDGFTTEVLRYSIGISYPAIATSGLLGLYLTFPPLSEQQHIVSFLDEKTAKIDEYIDKKNKEIEALKEWKKALIAHVVTKGLNTNAKMKDSGVSWIGEIPEHWELRRAKYMFKKHKRPVRDTDEVITCFRDGEVTLRNNRRTTGFTESLTEVGYQGIRKGDLVIHQMDAFAGAIGISDSDGKGTSVYHCCTPVGNFYTRFYLYVIRQMAYSGFIQSLYRGIRERSSDFNYQVFGNQFLYIPPIEEQQEIVEYIDAATTKADKMIVELTNHVESMKEYKQRLIADVVTGKINVQP